MRFRLQADATFDADDIDDAIRLLAAHFTALRNGIDAPPLFRSGGITLIRSGED